MKNKRIVVPDYTIGCRAVLYSDDGGYTWTRSIITDESEHIENKNVEKKKKDSLNSILGDIVEIRDMVKDPIIQGKMTDIIDQIISIKDQVLSVAKKYPYPDVKSASLEQIKTANAIFSELFKFL